MERHNPVNPKRLMNNSFENHNRLAGAGATPSMGLSQFRGGMFKKRHARQIDENFDTTKERRDALEASQALVKMKRENDAVATMRQMEAAKQLEQMRRGRGRKKHTLMDHLEHPKRGYGKKSQSEAMEMGLHLGKHLNGLHGGAFHRDFTEGVLRGGFGWGDIGNFFTNTIPSAAETVGHAVAGQFTDPNSTLRGTILPGAAKYSAYAEPFIDAAGLAVGVPGVGEAVTAGLNAANTANNVAKTIGYGKKPRGRPRKGGNMLSQAMPMAGTNLLLGNPRVGGSMTGAYEGQGKCGGMVRRMVGAGVSKRAEIVRKVMKEKGCSMIEASKYVKAHGLYQK